MAMHSIAIRLLVCALALAPAFVSAKGGGHSSTAHSSAGHSYSSPHSSYQSHSHATSIPSTSSHSSSRSSLHASRADVGVTRYAHGQVARSAHAKDTFRKTRPGAGTGKTYGQ